MKTYNVRCLFIREVVVTVQAPDAASAERSVRANVERQHARQGERFADVDSVEQKP